MNHQAVKEQKSLYNLRKRKVVTIQLSGSWGRIRVSHAKDPGSIPACRTLIFTLPDGLTSVIHSD